MLTVLRRDDAEVWPDTALQDVLADPVALEQIVHNLLDNATQALEAVPAGERRLVLRKQAEDGRGLLAVRDSGPGIAPDALAHVMDGTLSRTMRRRAGPNSG